MSLIYRVRRRLGYDTVQTFNHEQPFYEYEVTHLGGEVTEAYGHEHRYDEAFCEILTVPRVAWIGLTGGMLSPPWSYYYWDVERRLEGIQEIEREQVDTDVWEWDRDMADGTIVEKRLNGVVYE